MVFNECVGDMMKITAAQADAYNTASPTVKCFRENMPVIVRVFDAVKGDNVSYQVFTNNLGTLIQNYGTALNYTNYNTTNSYYLDYANDKAYPYSPINVKKDLTSANLIAGGNFQILPAVKDHYWTVLNAQYKYTFNTTEYTGGLKLTIENSTSSIGIVETKATFAAANTDSFGQFSIIVDSINQDQYIDNSPLDVNVIAGTGGDGTITVLVTAQLVPTP
jgi:hypothetical protein